MPEGPEVEKLRRQLEVAWMGQKFGRIIPVWDLEKVGKFFAPHSTKGFEIYIKNRPVTNIYRWGKWLEVYSGPGPLFAFHLGGTGWFLPIKFNGQVKSSFPHENFIHKVNDKAKRFILEVGDQKWGYHDGRTWGQFIIPVPENLPWKDYGPDWINDSTNAGNTLAVHKEKGVKTVKLVLCDQEVTAGIGNYLSCEICFAAKIHPNRTWSSLTVQEIVALVEQAKRIVKFSMGMEDHGWWCVFRREGEPCVNCKALICYEKDGGGSRGSYYCRNCQWK